MKAACLSGWLVTLALLAGGACALAQSAGDADLAEAYSHLARKDYDGAIAAFSRGLDKQPGNAAAHKDLAYTFLKAGENADARDEFEKAMRLNPRDDTAATEYAFLCYDTREPIEARRTFERLRIHAATPAARATAEQAFQNIDRPLAAGIARWKQALARSPNPLDISLYSAHWELAQLAEQRDELPLAAEQYEICRRMKPQLESLLVDLARVWRQLNEVEQAHAALLAASRGADPRTSEDALELLGPRYPYAYEFVNAIHLDPHNIPLRRELAYLYLTLNKEPEAIREFEEILAIAPGDQISAAQLAALRKPARGVAALDTSPRPGESVDPESMGRKSLAAGYVKDAIRYFKIANEDNPADANVMLQLGWAYNIAKNDAEAMHWFDLARHAADPAVAKEADRAWHNLQGGGVPATTIWSLPMFSTRWKDMFEYGQVKHNLPLFPKLPLHFYLSARFIGDARGQVNDGALGPQYLSESAFIIGAGVATRQWHHLLGWAEAGEALNYRLGRPNTPAAVPDYRGGLNFAKGYGNLLGSKNPGLFYETTGDAIFISRFDKDWLFYSQHRAGRTFHAWGGNFLQTYANLNYVHDLKNQYWANTVEFGPGFRLHLPGLPPNVYLAADFLRGVYTRNAGNPRGPNYYDMRLSFWYALSK